MSYDFDEDEGQFIREKEEARRAYYWDNYRTCSKCNHEIPENKEKCDKGNCDGVPTYIRDCDECAGKDKRFWWDAWICIQCAVRLEKEEREQSEEGKQSEERLCLECGKIIEGDGAWFCEKCEND